MANLPIQLEKSQFLDASTDLADDAGTPDENFTDVDLRSTEPHEMDNSDLPEQIRSDRTNEPIDDQHTSFLGLD